MENTCTRQDLKRRRDVGGQHADPDEEMEDKILPESGKMYPGSRDVEEKLCNVQDTDAQSKSHSHNQPNTGTGDEEMSTKNINSSEKALSIELIITEIFKRLPIPDLLRCSLVSKHWNFNARSVLRDYKKCLASIKGSKPCQILLALHNILLSSSDIPFNGLVINTHSDEDDDFTSILNQALNHNQSLNHHCVQSMASMESIQICVHQLPQELYPVFFENMTIKYLKFYWKDTNVCYNTRQFILSLLSTCSRQSENLIELSIGEFPRQISSVEQFLSLLDVERQNQHHRNNQRPNQSYVSRKYKFDWPKLKSLELPTIYNNYIDAVVIKDILEAAPHLQVLRGHVLPEYLDVLSLLGKIDTVKEFVLAFPPPHGAQVGGGNLQNVNVHDAIDKLLESALKFSQRHPSLQKLSITTSHDRLNQRILRQNPSIISEILRQLFHNSYTSLQQLQLDYQDFKSLARVQIISHLIPLSRLKSLTLKYEDSIDFYAHFNFVDLSPMFPQLEKMEFIGSCFTTRGFYLASLFRERYSGFTCESVRILKIFHLHIFSKFTDADGRFIRRISEFFPSIRELHVDDYGDDQDFFDIVWSVWPHLKIIHFYSVPETIVVEGGAGDYSFDPFFDGMRVRIKTFHRKFKSN